MKKRRRSSVNYTYCTTPMTKIIVTKGCILVYFAKVDVISVLITFFLIIAKADSSCNIPNDSLKKLIGKVDLYEENDAPSLHPVVQDFKELIEKDAEVNIFIHQMFEEQEENSSGPPPVKNYHQMLQLMNVVLNTSIEFDLESPMFSIMYCSMATVGGFSAFLNEKVNYRIKNILNEWGKYLKSKDSCYVLNKDPKKGWFGKDAMKEMPNFVEEFKCNPNESHYGFTSWDDFFTREFRDGVRPVASPDDNSVVVNPCEAAPFNIQENVKRHDTFWIKSQPYSLDLMLANDPLADRFVGGTVYQAFLGPLNYHRWHSPVNGKVVKAFVQDGTYYSQLISVGVAESQAYMSAVATRAIFFIEADNPDIGLVVFIAVGLAEVSTCEITVFEEEYVKKGQQIGTFHYGGSSHCLIFQPGVNVTFDLHGQTPSVNATNILVNAKIATVNR